MLDQNTDRMWYVIGALVVGAGIILLANKTMPEIFASVTGSFNDVAISATNIISNINSNLLQGVKVAPGSFSGIPKELRTSRDSRTTRISTDGVSVPVGEYNIGAAISSDIEESYQSRMWVEIYRKQPNGGRVRWYTGWKYMDEVDIEILSDEDIMRISYQLVNKETGVAVDFANEPHMVNKVSFHMIAIDDN